MHFTGSPLWNLFCPEMTKLESSYNINVRKIFKLPFNSHRCFIESITGKRHVKIILIKRFISFLQQILRSRKSLPKQLLNIVMYDTRSTTGNNLRNIFLLCGKFQFNELTSYALDELKYKTIDEEETWKLSLIEEIIEFREGQLVISNFSNGECEEILREITTS